MIALFPIASALILRAYELDPDWDTGGLREVLISLEPNLPGTGGAERSQAHYEKCLELQGGLKAGPHVSLATSVALKANDRAKFVELLEQALAVDLDASPENRLANDYAQLKARFLLDNIEEFYWE